MRKRCDMWMAPYSALLNYWLLNYWLPYIYVLFFFSKFFLLFGSLVSHVFPWLYFILLRFWATLGESEVVLFTSPGPRSSCPSPFARTPRLSEQPGAVPLRPWTSPNPPWGKTLLSPGLSDALRALGSSGQSLRLQGPSDRQTDIQDQSKQSGKLNWTDTITQWTTNACIWSFRLLHSKLKHMDDRHNGTKPRITQGFLHQAFLTQKKLCISSFLSLSDVSDCWIAKKFLTTIKAICKNHKSILNLSSKFLSLAKMG